jgi:hypothetical protein
VKHQVQSLQRARSSKVVDGRRYFRSHALLLFLHRHYRVMLLVLQSLRAVNTRSGPSMITSGPSNKVQPVAQEGGARHTSSTTAKERGSAWRAARTLVKMLTNSLSCTAVAWLLVLCIAQGNILSGRPPGQQTYLEFLVVKMSWFDAFYWSFVVATSAHKLMSETFATDVGERKLSFLNIAAKLVPPLLPFVVGVTLLSLAGGAGIACLPSPTRTYKADLYWTLVVCAFFVTAADLYTRHIYKMQTVEGQARELKRLGVRKEGSARRKSPTMVSMSTCTSKASRSACFHFSLRPTRTLSAPSR